MDNNDNNKDVFSNPFDNSNMQPIEDDNTGRTFVWVILGVAAIGCGILFAAAFFYFQPDAQSLVDKYFPSPKPPINLTATQQVLNATNTAQAFQSKATSVASE